MIGDRGVEFENTHSVPVQCSPSSCGNIEIRYGVHGVVVEYLVSRSTSFALFARRCSIAGWWHLPSLPTLDHIAQFTADVQQSEQLNKRRENEWDARKAGKCRNKKHTI
jgi:hypothetical protein